MSAPPPPAPAAVHVVAGALVDEHGRVLIAQRPPGKSFAGRWELPGGKLAAGEAPRAALARELREELGIEVLRAEPLITVRHRYPGAAAEVAIECFRVEAWRGTPAPLDGQGLKWCTREELVAADLLEADRPIVSALVLPRLFVRVPADEPLADRLATGPGRERTAWLVHALPADLGVVRLLEDHGDMVFVVDPHLPPVGGVGSVYSAPHPLPPARRVPAGRIVHGPGDAAAAAAGGADFLLVPDRAFEVGELAGIAAAGLPWYLDVATPAAGAPAATGRLRWRAALAIGRL